MITNQSDLLSGVTVLAPSDDPSVNGQADPAVVGDEDPTRIVVAFAPAGPLEKAITQPTAAIGEPFRYRITVPATPYAFDLFDVRIQDDLDASAADLRFVSVARVSGSGAWTPVNSGSDTQLVIEDAANGIDIPAGEQIVVDVTVVLEDTPTNTSGLAFTNTATFDFNSLDGNPSSLRTGDPDTSPPMTIVGPDDVTMDKTGPGTMEIGTPATFRLDVLNAGTGTAWNLTILDRLPDAPPGGTCDEIPTIGSIGVFENDGSTPVSGPLTQGTDYEFVVSGAPACEFTLRMLSSATQVAPGERLIVLYDVLLDPDSQDGAGVVNVAGATSWWSAENVGGATQADRREFVRSLTDGTVGVVDHEDAHTALAERPGLRFEKTVRNVTSGQDPATTASPGDVLAYRIEVENLGPDPLTDLRVVDELGRLNPGAAFEPGSLQLTTVPPGADASSTDPNGGADGTGLVDIANLSLAGPGDAFVIEFEITLAPVISNGATIANQSTLSLRGVDFALSDDPGVNGPADPFVDGDEDPTQLVIESAPVFLTRKTSADVSGDPNLLLAGETLRYTITVQNVGDDHAFDVTLRDDVPLNTTYVPGSASLNGNVLTDGPGGTSPLAAGLAIFAPDAPAPGVMLAGGSAPGRVATLVFDVMVDAGVADGTVISNQAFVSSPGGGVADSPSDDPDTPIVDDPTRDVVGSVPLLFAPKSAVLLTDGGTIGSVDPLDVLRYTIEVRNDGVVPATEALLRDVVPANTTYVADSVTLNGLPVGQPDGGVFPLVGGIPISSSDLTPPLPGAGAGTLSVGGVATVTFDLQVNAGTLGGTQITNQAIVETAETPNVLTDGDGNPATGPEPTIVVVGFGQELTIDKTVAVVGGGPALAGSRLEYTVRVTNVGVVDATDVVLTDDVDPLSTGELSYVPGSALLDGSTTGVTEAGSLVTADWSTVRGPLAPGQTVTLRFRADLGGALADGTIVTNTAMVTWNAATQSASDSESIAIGATPGVGTLRGAVWHDSDFDRTRGASEFRLAGWLVELERDDQAIQTTTTDVDGEFVITGIAPNDLTGDRYDLRFTAPGATAASASLGVTESAFTDGQQEITDLVVPSGSNLLDLNLPIDPNGVVYDSIRRTPVPGARVFLASGASGTPVAAACFDDPAQQGQETADDGYYKFALNFSDGSCPAGGDYVLDVVSGSGYVVGASTIIPPVTDASTPAFSVPTCPGGPNDAIGATPAHCEVQGSERAPDASIAAGSPGTNHHLHLIFDATAPPGSAQLFNNHVPLDPVLAGAVAIRKTTPSIDVSRGALVPYEIVVDNTLAFDLTDLAIVDRFPAGFRYIEGSARLDDVPVEPVRVGNELTWSGLTIPASGEPDARAAAGRGRRRDRGRVREPCPRAQHRHGRRGLGRGDRDRTRRPGSDLRLYGRDRQGLRRPRSRRPPGTGRAGAPGRATRDAARPGGPYGRARSLPHHLRDRPQRTSGEQLRPEARRPDVARRLPDDDATDASRSGDPRQDAEPALRRDDPSRGGPRSLRRGLRERDVDDSDPLGHASPDAPRPAREGRLHPPLVVPRRP